MEARWGGGRLRPGKPVCWLKAISRGRTPYYPVGKTTVAKKDDEGKENRSIIILLHDKKYQLHQKRNVLLLLVFCSTHLTFKHIVKRWGPWNCLPLRGSHILAASWFSPQGSVCPPRRCGKSSWRRGRWPRSTGPDAKQRIVMNYVEIRAKTCTVWFIWMLGIQQKFNLIKKLSDSQRVKDLDLKCTIWNQTKSSAQTQCAQ